MIDRNYFHNMTHLQRMLILIGICLIAATAFTTLGYGIINLIYGIQMADMQASMAFTNENVNIGALKILQSMMSIGVTRYEGIFTFLPLTRKCPWRTNWRAISRLFAKPARKTTLSRRVSSKIKRFSPVLPERRLASS